ncbi:MAG: hypothetical protein ACRDOE_10525, partial [Streptosporangiaceae bacterium]
MAMSMSLDGIAGPESADADGMTIFTAILGWRFPLRSWRQEQGAGGGARCAAVAEAAEYSVAPPASARLAVRMRIEQADLSNAENIR